MTRKDMITGKGPLKGNKRSKALNSTRKTWNPNLQKITIIVNGKKKRIRVSAKTMRTLKNKNTLKIYS